MYLMSERAITTVASQKLIAIMMFALNASKERKRPDQALLAIKVMN
jgi:hypothetical protein